MVVAAIVVVVVVIVVVVEVDDDLAALVESVMMMDCSAEKCIGNNEIRRDREMQVSIDWGSCCDELRVGFATDVSPNVKTKWSAAACFISLVKNALRWLIGRPSR